MEMMNRAIEDAADFRGMMGKIEARAAHEANMLRMQAAMQGGSELAAERRYVVLDRQPGENRAAHRARLKAERRARKVPA
jgi:hypothetical protein